MKQPIAALVASLLLSIFPGFGDAPAETSSVGPLRVHPTNARYFTDGTRKPDGSVRAVYLTGSHTWNNLIDRGAQDPPQAFNFEWYLDFLEKHHHNFVRLWGRQVTWYHGYGKGELHAGPLAWQRTGPGSALDGKPKFDLTKFNQSYFDRLRSRVSAARDRGIYVSIMFFGGSYECRDGWRGNPFNAANNVNGINGDPSGDGVGLEAQTLQVSAITRLQEAYLRKVIDTVNDLDNVLYEIANEADPASAEWQAHLIRFIHEYEKTKPKQHPVGMTALYADNAAQCNQVLRASPADWISPLIDAAGVRKIPPADGVKVSLVDSDHWFVKELRNEPVFGSEWAWKAFSRGHQPILMEHLPPLSAYLEDLPFEPEDPGYAASRKAMGRARALADRIDLAAMNPHAELATTGFCLAYPGREYVVYLPHETKEVTVDLSAAPGTFIAEWIHSLEDKVIGHNEVKCGARHTFKNPLSADAVLHLRTLPR